MSTDVWKVLDFFKVFLSVSELFVWKIKMGKQKKQRNKCHKENPTVGISVPEKEDENLVPENATQAMERIMEQVRFLKCLFL